MNSDYGGYGNYFNNEPGAKWQMETRKNKDGHKNEDQRRGKKARAWNDAEVHTSFPFGFGYDDDCDSVVEEEKGASSCGKANVGCHGCEYDKGDNRVGSTCTTGNECHWHEFEADNDGDDDHEFEADYDDEDEFEADYDSDEDKKVDDHRSDDNCDDDKCSTISVSTAFLRFSDDESEDGNEFEADYDSDDEDEFEADYDSNEEKKVSDHRSDEKNCGSDKCSGSVISAPTSFLRFSDNESDDEHESESNCDSGEDSKVDDHADQLNAINKPMSKREATSIWKSNNGNGRIKFVKKSKRGQSGIRYSKYKKGATPNECLELGATRQDLTWDIQKENAVMVRENIVGDDLL